jgi:predicted enzyme related to lactoylglutathione lyase
MMASEDFTAKAIFRFQYQTNMVFQCTDAFVTLASSQIEKLVDFYTNLLSSNPVIIIPNVYAEFQFPGLRLGIFKPKQTHNSEFENSAKTKMSLCLQVNNLENAIAHLTALGYPPPGEIINTSHGREIYAYDPDGNRLILHQSAIQDH